jgi:hypothetical protein
MILCSLRGISGGNFRPGRLVREARVHLDSAGRSHVCLRAGLLSLSAVALSLCLSGREPGAAERRGGRRPGGVRRVIRAGAVSALWSQGRCRDSPAGQA